MKGDRVEAVVDTGQGVQTFEIIATRAGRQIEVTTGARRGRGERGDARRHDLSEPAGSWPVASSRSSSTRLTRGRDSLVDVETRRRLTSGADS